MPSFESSMNQLESRLQFLFEGGMARLFPSRTWQFELVQAVTAALNTEARPVNGNKILAPDSFTVFLHPLQLSWFIDQPALESALAEYLTQVAEEAGYSFRATPSMHVQPKSDEEDWKIQVIAQFSLERSGQTASLSLSQSESIEAAAFLIVDGNRMFTITDPVTNIGRLEENHLVIKDGRVSRRHAQLRLVHNRYMIFDLDSSGGTYINGRRVLQSVLYPGDVISLAGVPMVFGLETSENTAKTQEISPARD